VRAHDALPAPVSALAHELASLPGVVAVVLGGSRATGTHRPDSDWDLGVYYRGATRPIDPGDVAALGHSGFVVSALNEWGPIMNGGAWLTIEQLPVDALFRDLDVIEVWMRDARDGRFEILMQNGYIVGAPTYLPIGELAICEPLAGQLPPRPRYPEALARAAAERWTGRASVALMFASGYAKHADAVACAGMLSYATLCAAHARLAARREWVLNEKNLVQRAGLSAVQPVLAGPGSTAEQLTGAVDAVSAALEVEPLTAR
jgi:predicted nucleotidyltransferase